MNKKTPKFNNIKLNKKEFHNSKESIDLFSVDLDQMVVSDIMTKALSILLVTKKVKLLSHYVLFCHK